MNETADANSSEKAARTALQIEAIERESSRDLDAWREASTLSALVFNSSRDCTVVLDLDAHTLFVSPGGIESMEISNVEAILGLSWLRVWSGADHQAAVAAVAEARAGRTGRFQGFCATHKGTPKWWDVVITPIPGIDGKPERLLSVGRDITEAQLTEQRLQRADERLNLALNASGIVGTWDWNLDADLVYADANFARIYNVDPAWAARGAPFDEYIKNFHPDDLPAFKTEVDRLFAGAASFSSEYRVMQPDGSIRWILARGRLVRSEDGRPLRFPGAAVDITERKQAEMRQALLLELSDRYRALSDASEMFAEGAKMLGRFLEVDQVGHGIVQNDELTIQLRTDHAEQGVACNGAFPLSCLGEAQVTSLRNGVSRIEHDAVVTGPFYETADNLPQHGAWVWVPLLRDGRLRACVYVNHSRPRHWSAADIALISDVAGRVWDAVERLNAQAALKASEQALRVTEAQFRTVAHALPNHVWTSGPDGMLDWFNEQVYEYGGAAPGELDGQGWTRMVHPDDLADAGRRWAHSLSSGQVYETEFRLRRKDGTHRWHIARAVPVHGVNGSIVRWVGTNTDIEDQKTTAEALTRMNETLEQQVAERTTSIKVAEAALRQAQKMEAIGQLTGGVSHDFNNILQVISGNLHLVKRFIVGNEKAESRIAMAQTAVARGAKLASQLLAFSRRQPLEPKVVNIGRLISTTEDMLRRALGEAVEVESVVSGGLWNSFVDPTQIENALLNLAINGRDAMNGRGKLTIEVGNALLDDVYASQHDDVAAGQYVVISVSDTGTGMPPEVIAKAFDPFFTTKPEGVGTGLGLSMVYGFVKQSNGHVAIYSEVGHGTTVKLYLPRAYDSEGVTTAPTMQLASGGTETILVAEDDEGVRDTAVLTLTELGYRVLTAKDATAALHIIESGIPIDLLFTDMVMPGPLRSPELARKARERLPRIAVLFTSGYTQNGIVHSGRLDPGVELLSKPYTAQQLALKLRQLLDSPAGPLSV